MTIGEMIRNYRQEMGISQREFARKAGISNVTISMYEKNGLNPKTGKPYKITYETYIRLASAMDISVDRMFSLLGNDAEIALLPSNVIEINDLNMKKVPLIGRVAAGEPILAEETHGVIVSAPSKADYALEIQGESMVPTYLPNDIIYIRAQDTLDYQGQVAVVLLDDEATVKHVYTQPDGLLLISDNPKFEPMLKRYDAYSCIRILGKVCGFTRMYRE